MNSIFDDVIALDATRMLFASTAQRELLIPAEESTQPSLLPGPTAEADVAELLEARVREELKKHEPLHRPEGWLYEKTSKWWAMSGMQKAVRRGNTLLAYKSARALLVGGCGSDLWRRLGVIATEDVGLGVPFAVAAVSLLILNKKLRQELGEEKCLYWMLDQLCKAPKCRALCDIAVWAHVEGTYAKELWLHYGKLTPDHWLTIATDTNASFKDRLIAHWLMFGKRYKLGEQTIPPCPKEVIDQFYDHIGLPPLMRLVCKLNMPAGGGDHAIVAPFTWQMMCSSPWIEAGTDWWDVGHEDEVICNMYACAFDKHTREGKSANAYFLKACPEAAEFAQKHCKKSAFDAMGEVIFTVEGGLVRPRLKYEGAKQVYDAVFAAYMAMDGWESTDAAIEFCNIVQKNLPIMNYARKRVLGLA